MNKEINVDEISKEIKKEIYEKMLEELPNLLKDSEGNNLKDLGSIIGETLKISIDVSMKYTNELVKRILEESNQSSDKDLK